MSTLTLLAPAKINLYLGVHTARDNRGYHRVDSVMAGVDFGDEVTLSESDRLRVVCEPAIDAPEEQTATFRALEALGKTFGRTPCFAVHIVRRIPERSGLGGSSTDAGAALRGACALWGINPQDPRVVAIAQSVGADVAFFLHPAVSYLAGAGDELREQFALPQLYLAIVRPNVVGSCAQEAYASFDEDPQELPALKPCLDALRRGDTTALISSIANNLAPAAIARDLELAEALSWLKEQDEVENALVSGSGACCYALCSSAEQAEAVARNAQESKKWWAISTKVVDSPTFFC